MSHSRWLAGSSLWLNGCQSRDLRPSDECRYPELCSGLRAPGFGSCSAGWPGTCRGSRLALRDSRDRGRAHAPVARLFLQPVFFHYFSLPCHITSLIRSIVNQMRCMRQNKGSQQNQIVLSIVLLLEEAVYSAVFAVQIQKSTHPMRLLG